MIQRGSSFGFALKARKSLRISRHLIWKVLQRDQTIEFDVLGLTDYAHASATDLFKDSIM